MFQLNPAKTTIEHIGDTILPKIGIHTVALMKMKAYVQESHQEIAWLGVVETVEGGFEISDVFLCEQTAAATTVDIDEAALSEMGSHLVMSGQTELYNKIKMWGHSHVNMQVFASGTDEATFKMFYENSDFFIRLICNKKDDITIDFMDCVNHIKYLNIPWFEVKTEEHLQLEELYKIFQAQQNEQYTKMIAEAKIEIKECVKTRTCYTTTYGKVPVDRDPYDYTRGDRFVTVDKREKKKDEEKEKTKEQRVDDAITRGDIKALKAIADEEDEIPLYAQKKTTLGTTLLSLPDVLCKCNHAIYSTHASTIWNSVEEVRDLMEEVFSAYDLGSKCCAIEDFSDYEAQDWFILYDKLWDWYYEHYMDDDTTIIT